MKMHLVSLGCARNSIDSEVMLGRLASAGWSIEDGPEQADVIIVNTCSFIESAIDESVDTILELAAFKKMGSCKCLIVSGCLPERFREEIVDALPEVDYFVGTGAFNEIVKVAGQATDIPKCHLPDPGGIQFQPDETTMRTNFTYSTYIKIAEGCNRHCTYCIIPKLRGKQRSRTIDDIAKEATYAVSSGVMELVLVAQETTSYGRDFSSPETIGGLLEKVSTMFEDIWIRVLYGHPESIDDFFIKMIGLHDNVCSYFDIPIQHASRSVLKKMGRAYNKDDLYRLFEKIRSTVPDASLRTTLITGFPGEEDDDFHELLEFIEDIRFDHLGVFEYSDFEDLPAHKLSGHVPKKVAAERYHHLMRTQMDISLKNNQMLIGKKMDVLIEKQIEEGLFQGRIKYQAPDIDGIVYIHSKGLRVGVFGQIKITDALEYDLIGEVE